MATQQSKPSKRVKTSTSTSHFNGKRTAAISSKTISSSTTVCRPFTSPSLTNRKRSQSPSNWRQPSQCLSSKLSRHHIRKHHYKIDEETPAFLNETLIEEAIESLCNDRIRPLVPDVLQRIKCLAKDAGDSETNKKGKFDATVLQDFIRLKCHSIRLVPYDDEQQSSYTSSNKLNILTPSNNNYLNTEAVILKHRRINKSVQFCNPHDLRNPYSAIVWRSLWSFLLTRLSSNEVDPTGLMPYQFKGGRYGLAVELQKSDYPSLSSLKLGQLCHLVQLAIEGGLLAYEKSVLQPISACRELCGIRLIHEADIDGESISNLSSISQDGRNKVFTSTIDLAECLEQLLEDRPGGIVLAQLKKMLLSKFDRELIPERLGHRKLTDCLMAPSIQSVCQLVSNEPNSSRRLTLIHCKFLSSSSSFYIPSSNTSSVSKSSEPSYSLLSSPNLQSLPPSPGSLSTAASFDSCTSSSSAITPEQQLTSPVSTSFVTPPIPYTAMFRSPSALTPISFLFLSRSKRTHSTRFRFSPSSSFPIPDDDTDFVSEDDNNVPFLAMRMALQKTQDLASSSSSLLSSSSKIDNLQSTKLTQIMHWDCFV